MSFLFLLNNTWGFNPRGIFSKLWFLQSLIVLPNIAMEPLKIGIENGLMIFNQFHELVKIQRLFSHIESELFEKKSAILSYQRSNIGPNNILFSFLLDFRLSQNGLKGLLLPSHSVFLFHRIVIGKINRRSINSFSFFKLL